LNTDASERTSAGPAFSGARASSFPEPTSAAACSSRRSGRVTKRAVAKPRSAAPAVTIPAINARISQNRTIRASTLEVGYVIRTAPWTTPPDAIGTAT